MIYLGKNAVGISDTVSVVPIDDTAGVGDTTKVWSADKSYGEINDLKSAINNEFNITRAKMTLVESENLLDPANLSVGYITANGTIGDNTSYRFTDFIPVTPGETLSFWRSMSDGKTTGSSMNSRFCCAFDSNKNVTTGGVDSNISTFVVPSGVSFMRFSFAASYFDYSVMVKRGAETPPFISAYFEHYYKATPEFMPSPYKIGDGYESKVAETSTGINLELLSTNIVKDLLYTFSAEIGNDFTNLIIGSGYPNGSYRSYITIDSTNLTFNINGSDYVYPHGLTIADYIKVTIDINDNTKAKVTLTSGGSQFTKTLGWYGFHTDKYAAFSESGTFTNVVFTVAFKNINSNTHIYGDSYVAIIESTSKWSHWLVADGYGKNALINAYPGEDSANALIALQIVLSVGCPKYLLWCLGMNDGGDTDAETPSVAWMAGINKVLELCEDNNITPIFATIPTVPAYNHEAKNAWVRSSGYRYVDFAKAVGANSSGIWFSGMLSTDNIHPSELGAKALWHQVLCDFPEITM